MKPDLETQLQLAHHVLLLESVIALPIGSMCKAAASVVFDNITPFESGVAGAVGMAPGSTLDTFHG